MATHARPKDRYSADKFDTGLLAGIAVKTFWGLDLANMSPRSCPGRRNPGGACQWPSPKPTA